jgi:anthranilate synthase component 1
MEGDKMLKQRDFQNKDELDPFYLYMDVTRILGSGEAFLLDASKEAEVDYNLSLIGAVPLLEVQVKDGFVFIYTRAFLTAHIRRELENDGFVVDGPGPALSVPSVIPGEPLVFASTDPMTILEALRKSLRKIGDDTPRSAFTSGFLGYIGFDAVHYLETLPKTTADDRNLPDIRLLWHAAVIQVRGTTMTLYSHAEELQQVFGEQPMRSVIDALANLEQQLNAYSTTVTFPPQLRTVPNGNAQIEQDVTHEKFIENVMRARDYIASGDIFQVVLSRRVRVSKEISAYAAYDRLRQINPSPYMFMAEFPTMRVFGASPEVQFRVIDGTAEMKPIAGTSKGRGESEIDNKRLIDALLADEKEQAEHLMLVDLCRNDLGRVSEIGSVVVQSFMDVEPYSHLYHLVSRITSRLRSDVNIFYALVSTFPAGTLSGAPKIRAMEIIDELEELRRGPYGGLIGMIDLDGNANTAIVIRTVVEVGEQYYVQAGAGIVADSDADQEWLECGYKAGALMDVLAARESIVSNS